MKVGTFLRKVLSPSNGWFGEAGQNNTPYIRIPLVVTQKGACEGEETTFQGWLTDSAAKRTIDNLKEVFGWNGDLEELAALTDEGPFVDMPCQIVTEEEEYNNKTRVVIKWLNAPGGGGKMMDANKALELARRLGGKSRSAPSAQAQRRPPADPDLDAPEDDIPF